jgi:DNA-binding IclR family transcriptional regulator
LANEKSNNARDAKGPPPERLGPRSVALRPGNAEVNDIEDADRYRAPALDKGLDILELLASEDEGLTQAEIAKALGRTPNENYRMLERLVRRGYVSRNGADRYELTLKLFGLAHLHRPIRRLVSQATPLMRDLAHKTLQSNHMAIYDRAGVIIIAQMEAPGYWGMAIRVGAKVDLFNTGSGHVLLAFRSPEERALMIAEQERSNEDSDSPGDLDERIAQVRLRGYEVMPSLQTAGVYNLSAPVLGPGGGAMAALTCPYITPLGRPKAPDIAETIVLLVETTSRLSTIINGQAAEREQISR